MSETNKAKALIVFIAVLIILEIFLLHKYFFKKNTKLDENRKSCAVISETKYIRGTSMDPIFKPEQKITALGGYYACHAIERSDIVLVDYSGNADPLIKQIKIVPGDKFHVEPNEESWNIKVNGEVLKSSEGEAYILDEKRAVLLQDYEQQYQGVMPEEYYYVLGNIPDGSVDSTRFGLVAHYQIIAKIQVDQ